jgi:magnesium transporter
VTPTAELIQPEIQELVREGAYSELRAALHGIPPADVADIIASLEPDESAVVFRFLPRDDAGEVFSYFPPEAQEQLVMKLGDSALRVVEGMDADDRARLLDELPADVATKLIASLSPEDRSHTQAILGYPPKSVGRLMNPDYVRLRPEWTVTHALEHLRKYGRDAETINVVYVIDDKGVLVDDLRLRQVFLAEPDTSVESLMNRNFVALRADQPQEEAVRMMSRYDRIALPVVDSRGVLLGIVTSDDVADVAEQEATEDIHQLGGVQALERPYMQASVFDLVKRRAPWLALLYMSELLTTTAIGAFEGEISKAAVLATFVPAIISAGGNSGSQASTLVIRALGLREIVFSDWFRVLRRELACGLILGLLIGSMGFIRINLWGLFGFYAPDSPEGRYALALATAVTVTLAGVVLWGSIMGAMLPMVLKRLKLDPAVSSTPLVATLVDVTGIIIYFTSAMLILKATILSDSAGPRHQFTTDNGQSFVIFADDRGHPSAVAPKDDQRLRFDISDFAGPTSAPQAAPAMPALTPTP